MRFISRLGYLTLLMGFTALSINAQANGGGGETFVEGVNYIHIKPPLVVNYGGAGKVKYIKAEISIRTDSAEAAKEVSHHMPLIRDTLIMLISSVTDEQMSSGEGKEHMRQEALAKLNEVLEEQTGGGHGASTKDAHAKEEKPKKDAHAKEDTHGKEDAHAKEAKTDKKDSHAKEEASKGPISDFLFDNLVVQK